MINTWKMRRSFQLNEKDVAPKEENGGAHQMSILYFLKLIRQRVNTGKVPCVIYNLFHGKYNYRKNAKKLL